MKKLVYLSLVCITALCLMLLVSCNENENTTHTHAFGEWTVTKEASCLEDGSRTRACQCGESEIEVIPAAGHKEVVIAETPATCTESGLTEGKKCSACGEIIVNQEEIPAINHIYKYIEEIDENGNIATFVSCQREACGHTSTSTAGLYDDEDNLVASWAELVNVYGLEAQNGSFPNLSRVIYENETLQKGSHLIIDDSITQLDFLFLLGCPNITGVFIPSSVVKIIDTYIDNYINLTEISVDEDNEYYKSIDGNLYSKDGKTLIRYASGKDEVEFAIPYGVETIKSCAIMCTSSLKKLYIPNSVTVIEIHGFNYGALSNVYFAGTTEEWEAIEEKNPVDWWISNNIIIHYDGKMQFCDSSIWQGGNGSLPRFKFLIDGEKIYINNILYEKTISANKLEIKNEKRILSYFEDRNDERINIVKQIFNNENWYILQTDDVVMFSQIAICQLENTWYFIYFVSDNYVYKIGNAIIDWGI